MAGENTAIQGMASIGLDVQINNVSMNFVQEIGDIGGKPSELDATCLKDRMKKNVPGVQEASAFEVTYLFDNSGSTTDYRRLKALEKAGSVVPVTVTLPDGTKFAATGYISTYVEGTKVDEMITAKLSVSLQSAWEVTDPT